MPVGFVQVRAAAKARSEPEDDGQIEAPAVPQRKKGESADEKRARKARGPSLRLLVRAPRRSAAFRPRPLPRPPLSPSHSIERPSCRVTQAAVKEQRRDARALKKETKKLFTQSKQEATKAAPAGGIRAGVHVVPLP